MTKISIEINEKADENWNKRLLGSGFGTTNQTKEISTFFPINGQKPFFLKFINSNGDIVGQLLLSESKRFASTPNKIKASKIISIRNKILQKSPGLKKQIYTWSSGPIIFDKEYAEDAYSSLCDFFVNSNHQIFGWEHPFAPSGITAFKNSFNLIPWSTFIIDLTVGKEQVFHSIDKHSGQKNIQRAKKQGILVEQITEKNLYDYFLMLLETRGERGGGKNEFEYLLRKWKTLLPLGVSGFLARKDNVPVSGMLFTCVNDHIIEGGIARTKEDYSSKFYSQDLIKWTTIEWGIENKMKYYNFAGFNPNPVSKKEQGIIQYKKKWGGTKYDYFGIQYM